MTSTDHCLEGRSVMTAIWAGLGSGILVWAVTPPRTPLFAGCLVSACVYLLALVVIYAIQRVIRPGR